MAPLLTSKKRTKPKASESTKEKKKSKKENSNSGSSLEDVKTLGHQLLSSRAHINNLPVLLSFLSPSHPLDLAIESLVSLQSFFLPLLREIPSSSVLRKRSAARSFDGEEKDPELVYKVWIKDRLDDFVDKLIEIAVSEQSADAIRDIALEAIMDFIKLGKDGRFQLGVYNRFLHAIVSSTSAVDPLIDLLGSKYFKYIDIRYFTYTCMEKIIKNLESRIMSEFGNVNSHDDEDLSKACKVDFAVHIIYNLLSQFPPLEFEKELSFETWSELGLSSEEPENISSNDMISDIEPHALKKAKKNVSSTSHISKKIRLRFTKAWVSFLRLPLPVDVYKQVLASLHQSIIPYMTNPSILCDFLTRSYDIGGVISVMALNGLFILMTQCGVEYPKFYEKLYALLTPAVFMTKFRSAFFQVSFPKYIVPCFKSSNNESRRAFTFTCLSKLFSDIQYHVLQLLDTCLKSSYLPAYLAAAFAKRLSRLALSVPPSGELIIIALIHNLLRRHPSINFLVHQPLGEENNDVSMENTGFIEDSRDPAASKKLGTDPFDNNESDPAKSNAMRSSLWEIETLRHHYNPAVSRFVASLENDLTVRAKTTEVAVADFASGSYATVFRDEIRRRIKQVPLAFYQVIPPSLFSDSDFPGWTFGIQNNEKQETKAAPNEVAA